MEIPSIFFLSGASGVGKTSIVEKLKAHYHSSNDYAFLHFDSTGVPSLEEMIKSRFRGEVARACNIPMDRKDYG
ncbi:MAG: hypothetical protein ACAF41_18400 [Leptolyngbya sp. BL-A-14]